MGKWSSFKKTLKRYQPDEKWQLQVDQFKTTPLNQNELMLGQDSKQKPIELTDLQLASLYDHARDTKAQAEALVSKLNVIIEGCSQIFVDRFETEGITSKKFDDGSQLMLNDEPYPFIDTKKNSKAKDEFYAWLKKNKLGVLLTLNANTMKSMIKARLLEGKSIPPGIDVFIKSSISRRGVKGAEEETSDES